MRIPAWVIREMRYRALVVERSPSDPEINDVIEILNDYRQWTSTPLFPCETSAAVVRNIHNASAGEYCIVWDERYFQPIKSCLALTLSDESEYQVTDLQVTMAQVITYSCAERIFRREPGYARAAIEAARKLLRVGRILSAIAVRNNTQFTAVMRYIRWWTLFHELGHELYQTNPELVSNIDEKIEIAMRVTAQQSDPILISGRSRVEDARIRLREVGVVRPRLERLPEIRSVIKDSLPREEVWCDFFAIEQLVLQAFARNLDPTDIYLAMMINYYVNDLLARALRFFDRLTSDDVYESKLWTLNMAMRADLRAMHLTGMLVEIFVRPLELDPAEYSERWINVHALRLNRFIEIEEAIAKLLSPNIRRMILDHNDRWLDSLSEDEVIRHNAVLRSELGWDRPTI